MRWEGQRESENVEDRRGMGVRGGAGIGCGGLLLVLGISLLTGKDPVQLLRLLQGAQEQAPTGTGAPGRAERAPGSDQLGKFASVVLADTEDTWGAIFQESGSRYVAPKLVLFDRAVDSACGMTSAAVGPFYCPADRKVYLDLSFFDEMARRFGASGDFAQAYVIAHEVGHHVQNLLGISDRISRAQQGARSQGEANALSVRLELQADCLAGVWAGRANRDRKLLEPGDVEEGLNAAAAIGDDRLQKLGQGYVQPESFTHGSSRQRVQALRQGLEGGQANACRTL
jgi:predicted metalloprotease